MSRRRVLAITDTNLAVLVTNTNTQSWAQLRTTSDATTELTVVHAVSTSPERPDDSWTPVTVCNGLPVAAGTDMFRVVGAGRIYIHVANEPTADLSVFDRQIRAFGAAGQTVLHNMHVAVVGLGGTGSAVFEQLVRLGVGTITIVDHKDVDATNVTRIHGSTLGDVGRRKVDVQHDYANRIGLGTTIIPVHGNVADLAVAEQLRTCDTIFSCTDDHRGRAVLSRIAYRYLIPLFNTGVQIDTRNNQITGIHARVTVSGPGLPCLLCAGQVIPRIAAAEAHTDTDRAALAREGYVPGLDEPAPAVIAYTTAAASHLVAEFLHRLAGLDPFDEHQLIMFDRHKINPQRLPQQPGCYCSNPAYMGAGDIDPFLDITWTS